MNKFLSKYTVITISVLTATLLNEFVVNLIIEHYKGRNYLSVFIGIFMTVIVFVPLVNFMSKYIKKFSTEYINRSKRMTKNSSLGALIGFIIAFIILFVLFAEIRHDFNVLADLKKMF